MLRQNIQSRIDLATADESDLAANDFESPALEGGPASNDFTVADELQILARLRRNGTWTSSVTELVNSSGRVASP